MLVICTAGHVDHGKSALVRALTGMEPDRFDEERRRGLTIDLGFAWCTFGPDGPAATTVAFVDLPGHQRFVSNMLAGAGSIAFALLVVSAEDGWMPQSQEHLEILDLLGVEHGIVAVTKADLVDEETLEFAVELTREELAGSTLDGAPIVPVSAATGWNLDRLRATIQANLDELSEVEDQGRLRLWVDRAFSVRGAGTVVTGTLQGGTLRVDDEVEVLPGGGRARIRSLQSLNQTIDVAVPGGRVAVNLTGVAREELTRRHALVSPGQWRATPAFEAWVRALPGREIRRRGDWHLHAGSGEWRSVVVPVAESVIGSGQSGYIRVELDGDAAALEPGDRFVLRESGRRQTVGGGVVLDVSPRARARGVQARAERVQDLATRHEALVAGDRIALLAAHAREHHSLLASESAAVGGLSAEDRRRFAGDTRLARLGAAWVDREQALTWCRAATGAVGTYHASHHIERAAPKDVATRAAESAGCPSTLTDHLVAFMTDDGQLVAEGSGVRLPDHRPHLDEDTARARQVLLDALDAAGFSPPELDQAANEAGVTQALIRELEASGDLVRLEPNMAVTGSTIERAHAVLEEAFIEEGPLTASRAKELLGTTRKYAMPLLAVLDKLGRTKRDGDVRIVRERDIDVTSESAARDPASR